MAATTRPRGSFTLAVDLTVTRRGQRGAGGWPARVRPAGRAAAVVVGRAVIAPCSTQISASDVY